MKRFIGCTVGTINILFLLLFTASAFLIPNVSPKTFWVLGFVGLGFPVLLLVLLLFILFWIFINYKYALLNIVVLAIAWSTVSVLFAFHPQKDSAAVEKDSASFKVVSYNVHYLRQSIGKPDPETQEKIVTLLKEVDPDILCMQEFYTSESREDFDNKTAFSEKLGMPHYYFSSNRNHKNNHSGVIVYSKYPILEARKFDLSKDKRKDIAIQIDIQREKDTIRIFNAHLQSIYLDGEDFDNLESLKQHERKNLKGTKTIVRKLKTAFEKRSEQVEIFSKKIKKSPYPIILTGDFNDPPSSYTYFKLREGLKDSFLQAGFGLGSTFSELSPTLRIDYILHSPFFRTTHFTIHQRDYSDHYPIVAVLEKK